MIKLQERQLGTNLKKAVTKEILYPSVTICAYPKSSLYSVLPGRPLPDVPNEDFIKSYLQLLTYYEKYDRALRAVV